MVPWKGRAGFGLIMPEDTTSESVLNDEDTEKVSDEKRSIDELQAQVDELKNQLLRAIAETQNVQKRAEKEKADISKYSISGFAKDVLRIRDNLQLALNSGTINANIDNKDSIVEGIKLTMSEMDKVLGDYGVKIIEVLGKQFDPNFHQAMVEIEADDKEPGVVVQVMQEGFMIYDRLLRPALVGVSKKISKNETEAS